MGKYLVTAGLPYSNGRLHVGHIAGCYLPADIWVRYLKMNNHEVIYVCGSDDHGVAIMLTAEKEGKTPFEVAQFYNQKQRENFKGLNIDFNIYGSTSNNSFHYDLGQHFFLNMAEKGLFEKKSTRQFYDETKNMFLPDRFIKGDCSFCGTKEQNGDQCENCGKLLDIDSMINVKSTLSGSDVSVKETVHWFLDLGHFRPQVEEWLAKADLRENTKLYVQSLIDSGLVKRSMTRDISWGIPLPIQDPDAKGKVLYVWFDAPIGYISNTMAYCQKEENDSKKYETWWKNKECKIYHFIGEDNTIFHCLIWIAMLSAESSMSLPTGVVVNQFLNIQFPDKEVEKISKSRGSAVWVEDYLSEGNDPDVLRYYLTSISPEKSRTVYKPEDLIQKNNSELANILGNFINRIISFNQKYVGMMVPSFDVNLVNAIDSEFEKEMNKAFHLISVSLDQHSTKTALSQIMDFARACNKYVDEKAPWVSRKNDMEKTKVTLYYSIKAIKFLAVVLAPFLPQKVEKICAILKINYNELKWSDALISLQPEAPLGESEILFQKIE